MKNIIVGIATMLILLSLIGFSKVEELPYAPPGNQYKIIYVTSDDSSGDKYYGENHRWLMEFGENIGESFSIIVNSLEGVQKIVPALHAKKAPYVYILSSKKIILETSDFEEAKNFLEENAK